MKIKFMYLKDPTEPRRVVTLGWVIEDTVVRFAFAANKVVPAADRQLDPRVRMLMEPKAFSSLQKRFRRRFGGDTFCRKTARTIIVQRIAAEKCYRSGADTGRMAMILTGAQNEGLTIARVCRQTLEDLRAQGK